MNKHLYMEIRAGKTGRMRVLPISGLVGLAVFSLLICGQARAAFVNFDDAGHMEVVNTKYDHLGMTFTGMSGGNVYAYSGGKAYSGYSPLSGSDPNIAYSDDTGIRIDFSLPVYFLSLFGVDYGGPYPYDHETAALSVFDHDGNLIDSVIVQATRGKRNSDGLLIPVDIAFLSVSAGDTPIYHAEFTFTDTNGFFGIDNVTTAVAPEPGSMFLFIAGGMVLLVWSYSHKIRSLRVPEKR
ncbi:MAG: hypothetical protein AB1499_02345 [Nitrospirota bacterium]